MKNNPLRGIRKSRYLTLDETAKRTQLDPGLLSKVERGIIRPSARVRQALVKFYDLPEQFLFAGTRK
ncbi:MAG: helix-turn-helix transcriptional regulator [Candidatus Aminicenantales bacterium]|jgi:transcriptional regulator with XRE-family HTH domain